MENAEVAQLENEMGREALAEWQKSIRQNIYQYDSDFRHSISYYLTENLPEIEQELMVFADRVINELDCLATENNLSKNLPRLEQYDKFGRRIDEIIHHPSYEAAGNIIYGSRILERMAKPGGLSEALSFMFLSSAAGEAGHNCPVACSAGIIRVLQKVDDFPQKNHYLKKLLTPSYTKNYTGAQFITEIQGGSDVGANGAEAFQDIHGRWCIRGEKWFCSNADAELILVTARFDRTIQGTKGLGLFLVPAILESGMRNSYTIRRLKNKLGTQSMATGEIDFIEAFAYAMGNPSDGFKMVMENVLHISRLFNAFCVLGMGRRAYQIALAYAKHRRAFGKPILDYPLVKEHLAKIKAENSALLASTFRVSKLQDEADKAGKGDERVKLLLRAWVNLNKYLSALWTVEHIHHALDILAGNGAIESFSTIPRLLRDSIICENWEGTHNVLRMQLLKDIAKYQVDELIVHYLEKEAGRLSERYRKIIGLSIDRLKKELKRLKEENPEVQSLQIKHIADRMAILLAALSLYSEAVSQERSGDSSKFLCLDYFIRLHLEKHTDIYNQKYIELITKVVAV